MTALTLKYNTRLKECFDYLGFKEVSKDTLHQAYKLYCKVLAGFKLKKREEVYYLPLKPVTRIKKDRTLKQKRANLLHKDRMNTAKQDMINHIEDLIESGEISYPEFMADPYVYFDSQIMGKYYNNNILKQSIVKYFDTDYIPF